MAKHTASFLAAALALAACGDPADTDSDGGTDAATEQGTDPGSDTGSDPDSDTSTPAAPRIQDALASRCAAGWEPPSPPNSIGAPRGDGTDMHRVTLSDPRARCNDGTQAVLYVRPGTGPAASHWVLHLQGGGGCHGAADCAARWCGQGSYDRSKMSSDFAPETMGGKGIYSPSAENLFRDATQVYFYYCSSDGWGGQVEDYLLTDTEDPTLSYTMYYAGHNILEAGVAALRAGGLDSDDGDVTLTSIDGADDVLFTGTSAGSVGVNRNLDWVAQALPVPVFGVLDASVLPLAEDFADPSMVPTPLPTAVFESMVAGADLHLDASCLAAHAGTDAVVSCGEAAHVALHHLTTPFFIRQDLADPMATDDYVAAGYTLAEVGQAAHATLQRFADMSGAEEPSAVAPAVYAPGCQQHVGLTKDSWFLQTTVEAVDGSLVTYQQALMNWLAGTSGPLLDTVPPTRSVCAAPDQDKS